MDTASSAPVQGAPVRYAGFWVRCAARFVDGLIVGAALVVLNIVLTLALGRGNPVAGLVDVILAFGYFCYMTKRFGATYGKRAFGVRVVAPLGGELTWGRVIMREVVGKIASGIILDIGYLMVAFTSRKQGLHDKIADTVVEYDGSGRGSKALVIWVNAVWIVLALAGISAAIFGLSYAASHGLFNRQVGTVNVDLGNSQIKGLILYGGQGTDTAPRQ